jgi:AmmeMemoRadiSam system protein B
MNKKVNTLKFVHQFVDSGINNALKSLIVPHAGLQYSGSTAGTVYRLVNPNLY